MVKRKTVAKRETVAQKVKRVVDRSVRAAALEAEGHAKRVSCEEERASREGPLCLIERDDYGGYPGDGLS